jgi:integrase/recombinase XerC
VELYALDLQKLRPAAAADGDLLQVQNPHPPLGRQMHSGGRSGRGIALILSGWRGFYTWLGREGPGASNPVQDVRAPQGAQAPAQGPGVDDAVQLAAIFHAGDDPWLEARDAAMVELLYGCGLRVGELVGLDAVPPASHAARGWVDLEAAEAHVLGKGSKRRTVPVGRKAMAAWRLAGAGGPCGPGRGSRPAALFIGRTAPA